jgi:hypothetical protein
MKTILLLLLSLAAVSGTEIAMMGIKIHAPGTAKDNLSLTVVNNQGTTTKYKTSDGNYFSITTENGNVVYMENDWMHEKGSTTPLFTNFKFGETTLKEIRDAFGTIGYSYRNRSYLKSETDLTTINCFEIEGSGEILVMITKAPIKSITDKEHVDGFLKLEAVILSDKAYLDGIWGKKKTYDPKYKKIKI